MNVHSLQAVQFMLPHLLEGLWTFDECAQLSQSWARRLPGIKALDEAVVLPQSELTLYH